MVAVEQRRFPVKSSTFTSARLRPANISVHGSPRFNVSVK
jgi:hypothetical protein